MINYRQLARRISLVENEVSGFESILQALNFEQAPPLIGITGPPGAGKSTLLDVLLGFLLKEEKRIAIIAVDPTSPFNYGALLGDRIRLNRYYNHPNVYIRSVATRGSLGGLSDKIMEITDVVRAEAFDYVFVETVGVGQSEVEIAGLADTTLVVMVPEAGDEIQTMKAGLMEIADVFVVNKADRPDAQHFVQNLRKLAHSKADEWEIPVVATVAINGEGIEELVEQIHRHAKLEKASLKKVHLATEKVFKIIQKKRMQEVDKKSLFLKVKKALDSKSSNLYRLAEQY